MGKVDIVVNVRVVTGFVRHLDGSIQKQYAPDEVLCPLQVSVVTKGAGTLRLVQCLRIYVHAKPLLMHMF